MTAPIITSPLTVVVYNGVPFLYQIQASGAPDYYSFNYNLDTGPAGIYFDAGTGLLQGSNYRNGTFPTSISAINGDGVDTQTLNIIVVPQSSAPSCDLLLQKLYEARSNYISQKLELSTKKKPSYNIDGQQVDWVEYLKYVDGQINAIQGMIIAYEGPYEEITVGFT